MSELYPEPDDSEVERLRAENDHLFKALQEANQDLLKSSSERETELAGACQTTEAQAGRYKKALEEIRDQLGDMSELRPKPPLTLHELDSSHDWEVECDDLEVRIGQLVEIIEKALNPTTP